MIVDALAGKVDLIITKSVSRFARNTVDSLSTIRKLKEHNIECYFEKENIWTFDSKGELPLTIMSSLAQEESRSISENVTWGHRKRFADGKVSFAYSRFLGYEKGPDGTIVVVPEQAKTVRLIYKLFLDGMTMHTIAGELNKRGIKTPGGKDKWNQSTVRSILTNEKYKGDALLQKSYTVDFLTKKTKTNEGEVPQYYVENTHEAIIDPQIFELVQAEIAKRNKGKERYSGVSIFSTKVQCAECGGWYGSKVWHSNDKYRRIIYQCNNKFRNKTGCSTPYLTEYEIKEYFIKALNRLITEKDEIIANTEMIQKMLCDNSELEAKRDALQEEIAVTVELTQNAVAENARVEQDQDDYNKHYNALVERYVRLKAQYDEVSTAISDNEARYEQMGRFITVLKDQEGVIRVSRYITAVYTIAGICSAIAGIISVSRTGIGTPQVGSGVETDAIAACVIGGANMMGGEGSVLKTVVGVFVLALIRNIMNLLAIPSYPQDIIKGAVIILAVLLQTVTSRKS